MGDSNDQSIRSANEEELVKIWDWNATVPEAVEACVHDLIAEWVWKQPAAPAVSAWDGELTYGRLDALSTRLAQHLVGLGVTLGQVVPLCFEKSMWMPVAMLGVMKAGGTSVAMDTTVPEDRLRSIVGQVQASIILSSMQNEDLARQLAEGTNLIVVEKHLEASTSFEGLVTLPKVDPSCPIYIVFTSGSTGTPKGVVILHRNFSSAIRYQQAAFGFRQKSRVYDFASYAFDAAWFNFLNTATCGGCLCIPSEMARKNDIAGSMKAMEITYAFLTPSVARLVDRLAVPNLVTLSMGGEPMTQEDVSTWSSRLTLCNGYGPAECTPSATCLRIDPQVKHVGSIGRGMGLVTWVVCSDGQQLAPIGALGELWLEGPLVGQGYLNDAEKTAAAFIKDPPWLLRGGRTHPGRRGRLYRTGDLVRYDRDGSLVFIGRNDSQVKIRGQRVELTEVEHHVRRALDEGGLSTSVVAEVISRTGNSDPMLAAFVSVCRDGNGSIVEVGAALPNAVGRLEERLAELVPAYMMPAAYIPMEKFPVTVTGKTDRQRLRDIGGAMMVEQLAALNPSRGERRQPETEVERQLGEIEHVLRGYKMVDDAVAVLQHREGEEAQVAGFVTIREGDDAELNGQLDNDQESQFVEAWEERFDAETYTSMDSIQPEIIGRDFIGWTSMYDGSEIDKGEMDEWLDDTIKTILNGSWPGHILEVGTGSGMILFNLTEGLESYVGLEPSERAVEFITKTAKSIPVLTDKVKMYKATAADVGRLGVSISPDLVVLNSVVQCFPSQNYLFRVVQDLLQLDCVQTLFFGDIRSYALHREFLAGRALHIAGEGAGKDEIRRIVTDLERAESELLIDPAFFTSLPSRLPDQIEHIEILPKKMHATNELSCYRYAAVVHVKAQRQQQQKQIYDVGQDEWVNFVEQRLDRQSLSELLQNPPASSVVAVSNIPHAKTIFERHVVDTMHSREDEVLNCNDWLSSVRQKAQLWSSLSVVNLVELARQSGYRVEVSWARQDSQHGGLDAIFHRYQPVGGQSRILFRFPTDHEGRSYRSFSTRPVQKHITKKIQEELREKLQTQLPPYMVPHMFTILDQMPVNDDGKIDRRALAKRIQSPMARRWRLRPPGTAAERQLQELWAAVLGVEANSISVDDSFLRIGGDSIGAMRLVGAAREQGLSLTVADVFKHPRLCDLAEQIKLDADHVDMVIKPFSLLKPGLDVDGARARAATVCGVDLAQIEDIFPCTPLQEGLIAMTAKRAGDYVARLTFELDENIDIDRLKRAWQALVATVSILRTRIIDLADQGLVQVVVDEPLRWVTGHHDIRLYLEHDKGQRMEVGMPLNWVGMVKNDLYGKCFMVWTVHHALCDGWSLPMMLEEVERLYRGIPQRRQAAFQLFVQHILEMSEAQAVSFWQAQLAGCEAAVFPELPQISYQPQADRVVRHQVADLRWPRGDITASTIVRTAWCLVMARHTDSNEVVFGATVTGRQAAVPGVEKMIGPTIVTVPVRVVLNWATSLVGLLQQVQTQALEMTAFEQTGLQRIRRISPETERGSQFQTLLVVQPVREDRGEQSTLFERAGRTREEEEEAGDGLGNFNSYALMLECQLEEQGLQLAISFDSGVIEGMQVRKMAQQLEHVLRQVCAPENAARRLGDIETVSEQDLRDIWSWNATVPSTVEACVHDLIAETVRRQPDAPAVCAWDGELTYGELDERSTRLAHHLAGLGVTTGQIVLLCFEKSMWTPVAMLGVMKAGGVSVAMDTTVPEDRLRVIVGQVKASIILSSRRREDLARHLADGTKVVVVERNVETSTSLDSPVALSEVDPSCPIYIVFTSGSTGTPKGVVISHRNFSSAIKHQQAALGLEKISRVYDFASYAFDVAWLYFLNTMACGGCLCIPSDLARGNDIAGSMKAMKVTFADLAPSVARLIDPSSVPTLSTMLMGGEPMAQEDVDTWSSRVTLYNSYGPAECTSISTGVKIDPQIKFVGNIGHGLGLVTWVVCSGGQQLAPVSAVGELWLEGPLVGAGYLNDPDKTAAAFVEDPPWLLRGEPGHPGRRGRLYKTGDLVRYNPDGTLVFLGRKDLQVKIRGQRVELGDVEYHVRGNLADGDGVQVVAEVITPRETSNAMLVAFLGVGEGAGASEAERQVAVKTMTAGLEEKLAEALPAYMIPTAYIPVDMIPMTVTGKTDRRRLRELGQTLDREQIIADEQREHLLPANSLQRNIQDVWAEVLNLTVESISMDSAFVRLGGDSITAMQVVSRCRAKNISITVGDVLRLHTIQKLSAHCKPVLSTPVTAGEEPEGRVWALSPIQQEYFDTHPRGLNHFNQSFFLKLKSAVSTTAIAAALHALVTRHPMLRARFRQRGEGTWEQYIAQNSPQAFSFVEHHLERRVEVHGIAQSRQESLDISEGPVFAADLFNIKTEAQSLLLSAHHLVVDLVSWRIIWHDMEQCLTSGAPLPQETLSFQTWCTLQQERSQNLLPEQVLPFTVEAPQIEYWGTSLHGNVYGECQQYTECVDKETTTLLLGRSNASFRTEPVDILLATLIDSFRQAFDDRHVPTVFLEGHGREPMDGVELDLSETVGWFTTLHPLQVNINAQNTIFDAVRSVKDLRRQVPGKGRPYFACRYYSMAGRKEFGSHDTVELLFNYAGIYQQLENKDSLFEREDRPELAIGLIGVSATARRMSLIDATVDIEQGQASISLDVNKQMAHQMQLQRWSTLWGSSLRAATRSLAERPASFTLSDFPLLSISYAGLESFIGVQLASLGVKLDNIQDIYPCTPLQEGVILSRQKGTATYASYLIWQCVPTGSGAKVSPHQLEAAWRCTAGRHSMLSTIFVNHPESGSFVQVQLRDPALKVVHMETGLSPAADALREIDRPSFSASEPEYAVTICQTSNSGEVACRLDISHALFDAASTPILARDLAKVYSGKTLPAAPSFREVVQHLELTPRSAKLTYWGTYLANVRVCKLPGTQPARGQIQSGNPHSQFTISESVTAGIDPFCRRRHITRSVFLQVAWALVLSQHTGMNEVCFGYLASGRDAPIDNIEELFGLLVSILVSRVDLSQPLDRVVTSTQEHSVEHLVHQHTSLAEIQHELGLGAQQLFNTAITVREADHYESDTTEEIQLREVAGEDPHEFDMILAVGLAGVHTKVSLTYQKSFMSDSSAQELGWTLQLAIGYLLGIDSSPMPADTRRNRLIGGQPKPQDLTDSPSTSSEDKSGSCSVRRAFFSYVVGVDEDSAVAFWEDQLNGLEAQPFPALPSPSYQPRTNKELTWQIDGFSWGGGEFAISTMIRASWAIILASLTSSSEAIFGATVNGGQALPTKGESTVGPKPVTAPEQVFRQTVVTMPVRVIVDRQKTVVQLLQQVRRQAAEMVVFERMGLSQIQRISAVAERASQFQALVMGGPAGGNSETSADEAVSLGVSKNYVIVLEYQLEEQGLQLAISFDSGVIEGMQVRKMAQQLEHVLRQVCAPENAARRLGDIETVSEQDLRDIWSWNATVPSTVEACVHDLIAETVRRQPDAPAVCAWDGELTYGELDERSTRLAHRLAGLGVTTGQIVLLCFEKSMWTLVAMLGVMKAGGASVAMDSSQPEARLRVIVQQVEPILILSSAANERLAGRLTDRTVIMVDEAHLARLRSVANQQLPAVSPSDRLYVVFTSGSTGTPKGAVITHSNFGSALRHQRTALGFESQARVYDYASYAFDVAWSNILHTLTYGGCLCIPSDADRKDNLAGSMKHLMVTHADLTPSTARLLRPADVPDLQTLILAGEPVSTSDLATWASSVHLHILYGPAECSVLATSMDCFKDTFGPSCIGRGAGTVTWVVDPVEGAYLAPVGAAGELWLEGPLVGAGYLNDPDKTAAAFVEDPPWLLRGEPGHPGRRGRLYKTGDLVRYNPDGTLVFLGRKDSQVKIRGQRVELGDVEYHVRGNLAAGDDVQVVAEVITPRESSNEVLVVFLEVGGGAGASEAALQAAVKTMTAGLEEKLAEALPAYMIPTAYIPVDKIPMTATGKTDRRRLREMGGGLTLEQVASLNPSRGERRPPTSELERRLQDLWASVLGIDAGSISADDSFLRIGGDSIGAMRLVGAAQEQGLYFTVADVFRRPRLHDLAGVMSEVVLNEDFALTRPFTLISAEDITAFLQHHIYPSIDQDPELVEDALPTTDFQDIAIQDALCEPPSRWPHFIIDLPHNTDFKQLKWACLRLVDHFEILRTVFVRVHESFLQVVLRSLKPQFDVFTTRDNIHSFVAATCENDLKTERVLGRTFIRFMAIQDARGESKLIFRLSHAQYDGFSYRFLFETLASFYDDTTFSPNPAPFRQFIAYNAPRKAESLRYWQSRLQDSSSLTRRVRNSTHERWSPGDRLTMKCRVKELRLCADVSSATLFHAACALVLSQQLGQSELIFGRLVTGRSMLPAALQAVAGPCLTELPVRVRINEGDTISSVASVLQKQFVQDSHFESVGMVEIIRNCTDWPEEVCDFGWRTSFQQRDRPAMTVSGTQYTYSFYERDIPPTRRPEIYAIPIAGGLELVFEGNRKLVDHNTVTMLLEGLRLVLSEF